MTNIAVYCVNYHSYAALDTFIESLKSSLAQAANVRLTLHIADNTDRDWQPVFVAAAPNLSVRVFDYHTNDGYFGAVKKMMLAADPLDFDYSLVSNVDLTLDSVFLKTLAKRKTALDEGWIAPSIFSETEKRDRNPGIVRRYSKKRLLLLRLMFRFPFLYTLYTRTAYRRKRLSRHAPGHYYAGHGAAIILTREYFRRCGIIDYPVFLFCEEIYLAEQCLRNGLKVVYDPAMKIFDVGRVSTGKMKLKVYARRNAEAVSYILNNFY